MSSKKLELNIKMFGGFTLSCENREVALGRGANAKFAQLLQLVWLQGEKGITKDQLIKSLYDREELINQNNSFNNLIYQMRRQMTRAGLPEMDYIVKDDRIYRTDPNTSCVIDVHEFRNWVEKAELVEKRSEKLDAYEKAFELYKGELLPDICAELWVAIENAYYKELYKRTVQWLGNYYQDGKRYNEMYRIYERASEIYPFDEWQVKQIEALIHQGNYKDAFELYDKTVRLYSDEIGLPPSEDMLKCYEMMSHQVREIPGEISEIKRELRDESGQPEGIRAYYCSYLSFCDAYRLLSRNMERSGQSMYLMLCTLVDYKGEMIQNQEKLKQRSQALHDAIGFTLRKGDAFTRYSTSQYLILLVGTNKENCDIIYKRISKKLKELAGSRAELVYSVTSMADVGDDPYMEFLEDFA